MLKFHNLHFPHHDIAQESIQMLFERIVAEKESGNIGYYTIAENTKAIVKIIEDFVTPYRNRSIDDIVVIGTGGSTLGTKAINSLFFEKARLKSRTLHFLENSDPAELEHLCSAISKKKSLFIVISKSGTTVETISIFKYILNRYKINLSSGSKRLIFITENDSPLAQLGNEYAIPVLDIPKNVGGRFSVLSNVGLIPLALAGFNVRKLLNGAYEFEDSFFARREDHLLEKAIYLRQNHENFPMNVLFSYSSLLKHFNEWYVQLWGESLGKIDKDGKRIGPTPIGLVGSIDQHSFLQLIMEGTRNKSVTFVKVEDFKSDAYIPDITLPYLENINYLNGITFSSLIGAQCDATLESLIDQGEIPIDRITFEKLNLHNIGSLIYYFELLTSAMGILFNINTYDQPGVELGKQKLKAKFKR